MHDAWQLLNARPMPVRAQASCRQAGAECARIAGYLTRFATTVVRSRPSPQDCSELLLAAQRSCCVAQQREKSATAPGADSPICFSPILTESCDGHVTPADAAYANCRLITADELESLAGSWNALAGAAFRFAATSGSPPGGVTTARAASCTRCALRSKGELIGLAPFYLQRTVVAAAACCGCWAMAKSVRIMWACSAPRSERLRGRNALAEWLIDAAADREHGWDALRLEGIDAQDAAIELLRRRSLSARGCPVHRRAGPNCWRLELPADWADLRGFALQVASQAGPAADRSRLRQRPRRSAHGCGPIAARAGDSRS